MLRISRSARRLLVLVFVVLLTLGLLSLRLLKKRKGAEAIASALKGTEYELYTQWIIAQAKHESKNFSSNVYKNDDNPFGMKVPRFRRYLGKQGTKAPDGGYYQDYWDDYQATKDLIIWLDYTKFPKGLSSVEEFATELKARGYFTDTLENYLNALERWLKK